MRRWVAQAGVDAGICEGVTSTELEEIRRLKVEVERLREDVAVLKAATTFFVGNSTPATVDHGVHRHDALRGLRGRVGLPSLV